MKRFQFQPLAMGGILFVLGLAAGLFGNRAASRFSGDVSEDPRNGASHASPGNSFQRSQSGDTSRPGRAASREFPPADSEQFADAVLSIFRQPDEEERRARFRSLLDQLEPGRYPLLVDLIRQNDLRGGDTGAEWTMLWQRWGKRDPLAAMDFIGHHDWTNWSPLAPGEARVQTLVHWARENPEGAVRYVEADENFINGDRSNVLNLIRGWTTHDPEGAANWLFQNGLAQSSEYGAIVQSISRSGGYGRLDSWFDSIRETAPAKDLAGLAEFIINKKMTHLPEDALEFLEAHLDEPWARENQLASRVIQNHARANPENALELAIRIDDPQAIHGAFTTWTHIDTQRASQWLSDNPEIPNYDPLAFTLSHQLLRSDREKAREFAESIQDEQLRDQMFQRIDRGQ